MYKVGKLSSSSRRFSVSGIPDTAMSISLRSVAVPLAREPKRITVEAEYFFDRFIISSKILYLIFDYPYKHYTFKYFEV